MTPQELSALISRLEAAPWTDFTKNPGKASRQLHVTPADVRRGEVLDAPSMLRRSPEQSDPRDELFFNALLRDPPAYELPAKTAEAQYRERKKAYGAPAPKVTGDWRNSLDVLKHAFMRDDDAKDIAKGLALTAGLVGGGLAPAMLKTAPALTGAAVNALTGIPINVAFGAPEGVPQDAVAGALMGKLAGAGHPGLGALAGLASYAATSVPEAEAAPFKFMTPERLQRLINEFGYPTGAPRTKGALSNISATNFLKGTTPNEQALARVYAEAGEFRPEEFLQESQYPFLMTRPDKRIITGHEGRHRIAAALKKNGGRDFDLPVVLRDTQASDWDTWRKVLGMLEGESFGDLGRGSPVLTGGTEPIDYGNEEVLRKFLTADKRQGFAGGGSVLGGLSRLVRAALPAASGAWSPSVVKPKGGNWISGSVEDALRGLLRKGNDEQRYMEFLRGEDGAPFAEWLRRVVAEDPPYQKRDALTTANEYLTSTGKQTLRRDPINSWIEGPLTKYVKTRMASPEDEVRRLAEEGVLHVDPTRIPGNIIQTHPTGQYVEKLGVSPPAKAWENASDRALTFAPKKEWVPETQATRIDPRVGPNDIVYGHTGDINNLGFNHLIDELSNALDPNSGLPPHLQLSPEAVEKMGIEKAVRRVADINAWRAQQQAAANAELANKASVVREYTDPALPNPKGLRWVELRVGEDEATTKALEKQLKYEGETMGHCVGGYCPDVLSGRSRIFSLRDAKGEPHVTVEVSPGDYHWENLDPEVRAAGLKFVNDDRLGSWKDFMESIGQKPRMSIHQIKGKQNRAPNPEYLPFVQDFVRNSPLGGAWGDVGDLQNSGLHSVERLMSGNMPDGIYSWSKGKTVPDSSLSTYDSKVKTAKKPDTEYMTVEEWMHHLGYASGGSVRTHDDLRRIIETLEAA